MAAEKDYGAAVLRARELRRQGLGVWPICCQLMDEGYKTKRGRSAWCYRQVWNIVNDIKVRS